LANRCGWLCSSKRDRIGTGVECSRARDGRREARAKRATPIFAEDSYFGLIPREDSSGEHRHQGAITKAGKSSARRALVEAAWAYQYAAKVSALIVRRQADVPKVVLDIAWKAQVRLCARFRRLAARGVNRNKIVVAIARELAGFVWAIAQQVKPI